MPTSFYDVVVLGTHLEALLCAALLGREGFRVLVLGQGAPDPSYMLDDVEVEPLVCHPTGFQSPVVQRTLDLLALRQDVRQRTVRRRDTFQFLLPGHRIDVDPDVWLAEIGRELPGVARQAADVTRTLDEVRAELDLVLGRGLVWPPETFLERQRLSFVASAQRYDRQGQGWTSWNQLAFHHPLRTAFEGMLAHVSGLLPAQHSDATQARLHGHVLGGLAELQGGWSWLRDALVARVRSWGGDVRHEERAESIQPQRRQQLAIQLARQPQEVACSQVVHGTSIGELQQLLPDRSAIASIFERVGEPRARAYRCSVHVLVDRAGVPESLGPVALVCPDASAPERALWLRRRNVDDERVLLSASTLVEEHLIDSGSSPLRFARQDALQALRGVVPFLDESTIWIDSPHDGLPPQSLSGGTEPACSEPWARGPYTMRALYDYPTRRALGVCALPTRTPVRGVFLCNDQVAPGLGFEGSFLAATSVARLISSQYRRRDWLRRGPWVRSGV